jgi:hypothetical protein
MARRALILLFTRLPAQKNPPQIAEGRVELLGRDEEGAFLVRAVDGSSIDLKSLTFVKVQK